jgi:hypothetical protein
MDEDMHMYFEEGIRGGMTFVNMHQCKAANTETGNPGENNYITYWDENNSYGNALRQLLPCSDFKWLAEEGIAALDWSNIDTEGEHGYTLKVDLEYPVEIHDKTQDFPLAPESDKVTEDMLTPYMLELWAKRCVANPKTSNLKRSCL